MGERIHINGPGSPFWVIPPKLESTVDAEIASGRVERFNTVEELIADLDGEG